MSEYEKDTLYRISALDARDALTTAGYTLAGHDPTVFLTLVKDGLEHATIMEILDAVVRDVAETLALPRRVAYREYTVRVEITNVRIWPEDDDTFPKGEALTQALDTAIQSVLDDGGSLAIQPCEIVACVEYSADDTPLVRALRAARMKGGDVRP